MPAILSASLGPRCNSSTSRVCTQGHTSTGLALFSLTSCDGNRGHRSGAVHASIRGMACPQGVATDGCTAEGDIQGQGLPLRFRGKLNSNP